MQNGMPLESLFSLKSIGTRLNNPGGVTAGNSYFSDMFNRRVENKEGNYVDRMQDYKARAGKAKNKAKAPLKTTVKKSSEQDDFREYQIAKDMEELADEAKELIEYISSLLGISAHNVNEVMKALLKDDALISGESADFMASAKESGAQNVQLIKLQSLVALLNETAEYLSSTDGNDPEGELFGELLEKGITGRQNEFKGLDIGKDGETAKLEEFARVVGLIKDAASTGQVAVSDKESEKKDARVTNAESNIVPNRSLSEIGSVEAKADADNAADNKESFKKNLNEPAEKVRSEDLTEKKADILKSMKVNILKNGDDHEVQEVKKVKLTTDTFKGVENVNIEAQNTNNLNGVLNVKAASIMDRSIKIDIITQIIDKARSALKSGQNFMKIQLKPEKLGEVFMRISVEDGRVMAKVTMESLTAKEAIETHLYQLKESLLIHGIKIDKFNVFVGDKWQEQRGRSAFSHQPGSHNGKGYHEHKEHEPLNGVLTQNVLTEWFDTMNTGQLDLIA